MYTVFVSLMLHQAYTWPAQRAAGLYLARSTRSRLIPGPLNPQLAYTWPAQPAARRQYDARRDFFLALRAKNEIKRQSNNENLRDFIYRDIHYVTILQKRAKTATHLPKFQLHVFFLQFLLLTH